MEEGNDQGNCSIQERLVGIPGGSDWRLRVTRTCS